jgi:hypothetical protein
MTQPHVDIPPGGGSTRNRERAATPEQLSARDTRNQVRGRDNWGGARTSAGRRRMPLVVRIREGSFNASRPGHRRALLEDELPADVPLELRGLQEKFRLASAQDNMRWAGHLARLFEAKLGRLS